MEAVLSLSRSFCGPSACSTQGRILQRASELRHYFLCGCLDGINLNTTLIVVSTSAGTPFSRVGS